MSSFKTALLHIIPSNWIYATFSFFLFHLFKVNLIIFREMGREGGKKGEKHHCVRDTSASWLLHTPSWGPDLQPRHVPWLGIEPATLWFVGWCSIHWATPARANWQYFKNSVQIKFYVTYLNVCAPEENDILSSIYFN